jgi:hypothetical protein
MSESYYRFLTKQSLTPRQPQVAVGLDAIKAIEWIVQQNPTVVHYDLETTGLQYADPNQIITNVGLASPDWLVGIDLMQVPFELAQELWAWLGKQNLGGFNLGFDLAWPWRTPTGDGRVNPNVDSLKVASDTALWFRLLATEGHYLQNYQLETLISNVLGWPDEYLQKDWLKHALSSRGYKKSEMWRLAIAAPTEYTTYCALDAEASYQAHGVFQDVLKKYGFEGLNVYHDSILVPKVKRNIKACCHGIPINREKLIRNLEWCHRRMLMLEAKALAHPEMQPIMEEYTQAKLAKSHTLRYNMKKVWAKASDEPWKYPNKYRVAYVDDPAKQANLPKWCREFGGKFYTTETQFTISNQAAEWPRFNVNSIADMKWLLYTKWLEDEYSVWHRNPANPKAGGLLTVRVAGKEYQLDLTKSGGLPTGGPILTLFGEIGSILDEYKSLQKLSGDFLEKFEAASRRTGHIHPQGKVLGTQTGRMSGGN